MQGELRYPASTWHRGTSQHQKALIFNSPSYSDVYYFQTPLQNSANSDDIDKPPNEGMYDGTGVYSVSWYGDSGMHATSGGVSSSCNFVSASFLAR